MEAEYTPPGWYPSPENPGLVRYWDGEMWTESTRPSPNTTAAAGAMGGPDHHVQHSALVAGELRDGETIRIGYRGSSPNTGRRAYVVATDQRVFVLHCKYLRRSQVKSVESMDYDEIDTVGTVVQAGMVGGIITSGDRSVSIPYYGGGAEPIVQWVRLQIEDYDEIVNVRSLPSPHRSVGNAGRASDVGTYPPINAEPSENSADPAAYVGVADEIRKLADLLDEGLLTADEFAIQKQRLLNG